jgi:hypothetical protein
MKIHNIQPADRKAIRKFIRFPFDLYKNDPNWVPPFVSEMQGNLQRKHPFFQHSEAAFFLTEENGQTLGHIAVMENKRTNEFRGTNTAFFGFFEP